MTRQREKSQRVFSSVSDARLAEMLAEDFKRTPSEFSPSMRSANTVDRREFLRNTSARAISPMKKWL